MVHESFFRDTIPDYQDSDDEVAAEGPQEGTLKLTRKAGDSDCSAHHQAEQEKYVGITFLHIFCQGNFSFYGCL